LSDIRQTITDEIKEIAENGVSQSEMQKLRNQLINDEVRSRQSSLSRAQHIAEFALYDGNPTLINSQLEELLAISAEEIKTAVATFLNTDNHALLDVVPANKE
jgi:predicted Zn-dependent peptidase